MKLLLILALVLAVWGTVSWAIKLRTLATSLWVITLFVLIVIALFWR